MIDYNTKDLWRVYRKEYKGSLSYNEYKAIIAEYHKKISNLILGGLVYEMPSEICTIKVIENKRKISINEKGNIVGATNWGDSLKLKAEILARGGTLYKEEKHKDGTITNNSGEKWLCYHTDDSYFIWIKISSIKLHNAMKYSFEPTWTNARALAKVPREEASLLFNKRHSNGTSRDYLKRVLNAAGREDVWAERFKLAR